MKSIWNRRSDCLKTLLLLSSSVAAQNQFNALVVDSSFAPLQSAQISLGSESCYLFHENSATEVPTQGECFDKAQWSSWSKKSLKDLERTAEFALAVHGSRSAYLMAQASGGVARPLLLRAMSAQAGALAPDAVRQSSPKFQKYKNQCTLINWTPSQETSLRQSSLLEYQDRIASLLRAHPSIKVVNISLGYKENWIAEDSKNCNPDQVRREFEIMQATWSRLLKSFPDRIFVVAAGNEAENFDRADMMSRDLWASLVDADNLLIVGAMRTDGRKVPSSNHGLAVQAFMLGDEVPVISPSPSSIKGEKTLVGGTSFAAPIVAGQLLAQMHKSPKKSVIDIKKQQIETLRVLQQDLLMKSFEKFCKGKSTLNECLDVLSELIARPLLWRPTYDMYLKGRNDWDYKPFALQFQEDLAVQGEMRLLFVENNLIPALLLKPNENPWELLLTLHHELFHFSQMRAHADKFYIKEKIDNCVTEYQLALLKDEIPAYREELEFYKSSPAWFKKKLSSKKITSSLFAKSLSYAEFYKNLESELNKGGEFLYRRYVELGLYPNCVLSLLQKK